MKERMSLLAALIASILALACAGCADEEAAQNNWACWRPGAEGCPDAGPPGQSGAGGSAGVGGTAGNSGTGGSDASTGGTGQGGTSGNAGEGGTAGVGGTTDGGAGTGGTAGTSGAGGTSGTGGTAGTSGAGGTSGTGGAGGCPAGLTDCSGVCQDLQNDAANCGDCGNACQTGYDCQFGSCHIDCPADQPGQEWLVCLENGVEVCINRLGDPDHCGDCSQACGAGEFCNYGACSTNCVPGPETCDGADNDCNGLVDDGVVCQCVVGEKKPCGSVLGTCQQGQQTCIQVGSNTMWDSTCVGSVGPASEVCDGLDNDCNGTSDDGITCQCVVGSTRVCGITTGECAQGQQTCVLLNGVTQWGTCNGAVNPAAEICDGKDNDCNGANDDGVTCACNVGSTRTCGSSTGQCKPGNQSCLLDANTNLTYWSPVCAGATGPVSETCNSLDDDCNGVADDAITCQCVPGSTRPCGSATGVCKQGVQTCDGTGTWGSTCANVVGPVAEICDGLDNDCNGGIDDGIGCQCIPGAARMCGTDIGECKKGVQTCAMDGKSWSGCVGSTGPGAEVCDHLDNDCNGLVDETGTCQCEPGEQRPCGSNVGSCDPGLQACVADGNGGYIWSGVCAGAVGPVNETCNNLDDDCNGVADDAITCQCTAGATRTCGSSVGQCEMGIQTCQPNNTWGSTCANAVNPAGEVCDGLDNDCNGSADDGILCPCVVNSTRTCGSNVGLCQQGNQTCLVDSNGLTYWSAVCAGAIGPSPETCNGQDDDCNGVADENCSCNPGSTRVCGSAVGMCKPGTQTCTGLGVWGPTCDGYVGPAPELCNGVDDNCNGTTDETCSCQNGSTMPCGLNVGACSPGITTCAGGVWGDCIGEIGPGTDGPPFCDNIDNNCNGLTDETCSCLNGSILPCGLSAGQCSQGTSTCTGGVWAGCVGYTAPIPETCNGLDDNCNNLVDDGLSCGP